MAGAQFWLKDGVYTLKCGERTTLFKPAADQQAQTILSTAVFKPPRWKRRAYALARDETGTYYYVDRMHNEDERLSALVRAARPAQAAEDDQRRERLGG